jgi:hypothetical protein
MVPIDMLIICNFIMHVSSSFGEKRCQRRREAAGAAVPVLGRPC